MLGYLLIAGAVGALGLLLVRGASRKEGNGSRDSGSGTTIIDSSSSSSDCGSSDGGGCGGGGGGGD